MPKKILKINRFEGGINNVSDPRDLADNELINCSSMTVHKIGKLSMLGGVATGITARGNDITSGYGLFHFKHDRVVDSLLITTGSGHGRSVGDWVGTAADFTHTNTSVGYVYAVPSTTTMIVSRHKTGDSRPADEWASGDDVFYSNDDPKSFTDTNAADTGVNVSATPTKSTPETGEDYILFADCDAVSNHHIYDKTTGIWRGDNSLNQYIDLGATTSATSGIMEPVYFQIDGAVRVSDANFRGPTSATRNIWYGYINRTHFNGLAPGGSADVYNEWTEDPASGLEMISAPTRGLAGVLDGTGGASHATNLTDTGFWVTTWETEIDTGEYLVVNKNENKSLGITSYTSADVVLTAAATDWNGDDFGVFTDAGKGFNLDIASPSGSDGNLTAGTYEFGTTFIYDDEPGGLKAQESVIYTLAGTSVVAAGESWGAIQVYCTSPYPARITGGIVYTRIKDSGDSWSQIMEISLKNGVRRNSTESYQSWGYYDADADAVSIHIVSTAISITKLQPYTYTLNTGRPEDITTIYARYKTAVVVNRRVYIGNVEYDGVSYADMMIKTPVNQPDVYSISNSVEISTRDGDEIIKLEAYADRILQFKKNKMHIYNVAGDVEFLESTHDHCGVTTPSAVCKTDFGIAWVNRVGCYLYDGEKVHNLLERDGKPIIKIEPQGWSSFIGATDIPNIGYIPKFRQLLVQENASSNGYVRIYDFRTRGWSVATNPDVSSQKETNYITDWNNDLIFAHTSDTGTFVKWQTSDASGYGIAKSVSQIHTKHYDFGHPGVKKKVYKVYVTYRGDASSTIVAYDVDGEPSPVGGGVGTKYFNGITSLADPTSDGSQDTSPLLNASSSSQGSGKFSWIRAELKPANSSDANNIDSFALTFSGTLGADFQINDISIIYRLKSVK